MIYPAPVDLDAASGEPMHPAARSVLDAALERGWADPRRLHRHARDARLLLDNAREVVAESLGVRRDEVTFTSSGTDAVHRGLLGLLEGRARPGAAATCTLSAVEHSAVLHAASWHARRTGADDAVLVPVDRHGRVSPAAVQQAVGPRTGVVAVQAANHEVGTVQPVAEVAAALEGRTPLFVDACASTGRLDLPGGWDAAAASAHKWGGPAGVGVLLVRKGARWATPFPGDDRVDERASGFENVPAALAAAAALRAVVEGRAEVGARQHALVARVREGVAGVPDVDVVGDPDDRLPHLVTFSFLYVDGEALVHELDRHGFGVASGSACSSSTFEPSHVLAAMGALTHGNVRLSLHRTTTDEDVERLLGVLPGIVADLRARVGM
ncbi:cysteine desulfurase family protein [Nocardioides dokdonensis]|uniref:cysteine desulfurase family protein n=1 Tax=Nocardioides dokdonensis TaxID=450734 RepID=UPI001F1E0188|nr:aminotransferase class V-fold PLP-dependent enzyme [Nocardioides dokdonensis]